MITPASSVVLMPSTTVTASGAVTGVVTIPEDFKSCKLILVVSAASGTTPTLNVYVQDAFTDIGTASTVGAQPNGSPVWDDFVSFTQMTATGTRIARVVSGGNVEAAASDAALTAGSVRNGPLVAPWRIKYVVGGTTPSFTFYVLAQFIGQ